MKKILAFLMFGFFIHGYKAQNYIPFPEKTAIWDVFIQYSDPNPWPVVYEYNRYTMEGDTSINGLSYNKIYCSNYTITYYPPPPNPPQIKMIKLGYCYGIRQDIPNKKVYRTLTIKNKTIDTLLYDYNLNIGDTVPITFTTSTLTSPQTVERIDSISFMGRKYRRFKLKTIGLNGAALIEGIGNANGLSEPHLGCFEGCYILSDFCDLEYNDCKKMLVLNTEEERKDISIQYFPNPFTDELTIQFNDESKDRTLIITDMLGREIQSLQATKKQTTIYRENLKKGIYFFHISDNTGRYTQKIIVN